MTSIVIAEKPDQASLYRGAVGNRFGQILAARGHLFELCEPQEVNPAWKEWSAVIMRPDDGMFPSKLKADADVRKRYKAIKEAAKRADTIYIATDPDREGEGIGRTIVNTLAKEIGWKGRVLRVLPLAQDNDSLRRAFEGAQAGENFDSLFESFTARQQADQIYNLSLTRSATKLFKSGGARGALSVGRVLTPTLGLVCRRELEIRDFKPEDYFEAWVDVTASAGTSRLKHRRSEKDRIFDRAEAQRIAGTASGWKGPIQVSQQRKKQAPPSLFSMAKLQVEAQRRLKFSVSKTTDVLQQIYEAKAVTYPRSSEVSLPETEIANAPDMMQGILGLPGFERVSWDGPTIRRKAGAFSDKDLKGAAHFAIVPNINTVNDWPKLHAAMTADQRKLFELIARRYLSALGPDRVYDSTKQWITIENLEFSATGSVEVSPGWREALARSAGTDEDTEAEKALPPFVNGQPVDATGVGVDDKQTTPPPRYTDASLVIAMIEAYKHVDDPQLREILKETEGIGTPATRESIVSNLLKRGFIEKKGKGGTLQAGAPGLELYQILNKAAPRTLDVGLTGRMEILLEDVKSGERDAVTAIEKIVDVAAHALGNMKRAKEEGAAVTSAGKRAPTSGMQRAAKAKAKRERKPVPRGVLSDFEACRAYLGPYEKKNGDGGPSKPSDKALSFAEKIASEGGIELPDEAKATSQALSKWIDKYKSKSGSRSNGSNGKASKHSSGGGEPTSKQVGFAEKIASRGNLTIPPHCYKDRAAMSQWIDSNK